MKQKRSHVDKHTRYKQKLVSQGRCPHCGKLCAPFYECEERRAYKAEFYRQRRAKAGYVRGPYKVNQATAQVNFFCPEQRAAFMRRPCEGFWEKIAQAREKWPNHQFDFPLNKCVDCQGDKLIPPDQQEQIVEKKINRSDILEAMEVLVQPGGFTTKKLLADHMGVGVANLSYHLAKMHGNNLINITSPGIGLPDQISWPTPQVETLPDKAIEVQEKGEMAELVQEKEEKAGNAHEVKVKQSASVLISATTNEVEKINMAGFTCKTHPHLPAVINKRGQSMGQCRECLANRGHRTLGIKRPKSEKATQIIPEIFQKPTNFALDMLFRKTVESLPAFDPSWAQEVWDRWDKLWSDLWGMARELDGIK